MRRHKSAATTVAVAITAVGLVVGPQGQTALDLSGKWSPAGTVGAREGASSVLLPGGEVLVFGGRDGEGHPVTTAALYVGGSWSGRRRTRCSSHP